IPALGVVRKEGLNIGREDARRKERGRQHGTNVNASEVGGCGRVITHSLVREKRHQSSLEAETQLIDHVRAEGTSSGGGPLVAVRDLTTQLLTERTRRQEGIEIVEEVRRGVEMRVMVDRADLVIFSRIPVQPDVGEPASPSAWLIEGRVVQP